MSAVWNDDESTTHRLTAAEKAMRDDPAWLDAEADVHAFRGEAVAREAMRNIGAAHGFAFRAEELRYDARGGMTAEQTSRAFVIGSLWTLYGEPLAIESSDANGGVWLDGLRRAHGFWVRPSAMTREHGWKLVALATGPAWDAAGGHAPPGGWP